MKIFWSWLSDTLAKSGGFLIRDTLQEAIEQLKEVPDIEEPTAQANREEPATGRRSFFLALASP